MSEKKVVEQEEQEQVTEAPAKKPVAKAKAKEAPAAEPKKENFLKRGWKWAKKNKKSIGACVLSFFGGAATAVGAGVVLDKRAQRRNEQYAPVETSSYNDDNSLDPNV